MLLLLYIYCCRNIDHDIGGQRKLRLRVIGYGCDVLVIVGIHSEQKTKKHLKLKQQHKLNVEFNEMFHRGAERKIQNKTKQNKEPNSNEKKHTQIETNLMKESKKKTELSTRECTVHSTLCTIFTIPHGIGRARLSFYFCVCMCLEWRFMLGYLL